MLVIIVGVKEVYSIYVEYILFTIIRLLLGIINPNKYKMCSISISTLTI